MPQPLGHEDAVALRAAELTYPQGVLEPGLAPPGYRRLDVSTRLRRRDLDAAARDLFGWRVHEGAGLRAQASDAADVLDAVVLLRLGVGRWSLRIPCRVVEVIDEPNRRGFVYGTLPGHPESGEERFVLDRAADGALRFTVTAVSRPASFLARLGGPVSRLVQKRMARRYLAALDRVPVTATPPTPVD
ncbi:hypothetical protein GCM10009868_34900 [Terrabacter aerolatus]|uniref:DUF1990 domain-containing protein n=1 Tax=Terrabacter aerolatus TaxID=422442 RepID=A0A512CWF6_9MICO|nr:DUF1990 domain-containing protein [Terrabacter aerolatus]GEO28525.1 hypothetical protein TAE01_03350 [Terrabacter aerolatus]